MERDILPKRFWWSLAFGRVDIGRSLLMEDFTVPINIATLKKDGTPLYHQFHFTCCNWAALDFTQVCVPHDNINPA